MRTWSLTASLTLSLRRVWQVRQTDMILSPLARVKGALSVEQAAQVGMNMLVRLIVRKGCSMYGKGGL